MASEWDVSGCLADVHYSFVSRLRRCGTIGDKLDMVNRADDRSLRILCAAASGATQEH